MTKSQEKFVQQLGLTQWIIVEPVGNIWKPRGKKIYVEHRHKNSGANEYLRNLNFIQSASDAGGKAVIEVILK